MVDVDTICRSSLEAFDSGDLDKCSSLLQSMDANGGKLNTLKLQMNTSLAALKQSGYHDTGPYRDTICQMLAENRLTEDTCSIGDLTQHGYLMYNYAVLLFHACQYKNASKVLQNLLDAILQRNGDSRVKHRKLLREVCFLLMEISLMLYQGSKATEFLLALEETCELKTDVKEDRVASEDQMYELKCRYRLQQYKIRCYLLMNNLKGYKKEIKVLTGFTLCQPFKQAFFKAEQEWLRQNPRKAVKCLTSISAGDCPPYNVSGDCILALIHNAFGCIYSKLGKPNVALTYFKKGIAEFAAVHGGLKQPGGHARPMFNVSTLWRYALLHNIGVTLLQIGKPIEAFDLLIEVADVFHNSPRLWLRLAECCIRIHKTDNKCDFLFNARKGELVRSVIGVGPHRKLVLNFNGGKPLSGNTGGGTATLEFAAMCLKNTLCLLAVAHVDTPGSSELTGPANSTEGGEQGSVEVGVLQSPPGSLLTPTEIANIRTTALLDSAYVALCLGEHLRAIRFATKLLESPNPSNTQKMIGHLFKAEALLVLNRTEDALECLNLESLMALTVPHQTSERSDQMTTNPDGAWYLQNAATVQTVLCYNRCLIYTFRKKFEKAAEELDKIPREAGGQYIPIQALMLSIYIRLQLGQTEYAMKMLKHHLPKLR